MSPNDILKRGVLKFIDEDTMETPEGKTTGTPERPHQGEVFNSEIIMNYFLKCQISKIS